MPDAWWIDMTFNQKKLKSLNVIKIWGKVTRIVGLVIEGYCPHASIGSLCELTPIDSSDNIYAEIVGFKDNVALLMPLGELRGLGPGSLIRVVRTSATINVGANLSLIHISEPTRQYCQSRIPSSA